MKEIKFRAWDLVNKYMIYDIQNRREIRAHSGPPMVFHFDSYINKVDYTVEFFTGLRDKNGKEIYEGDIICYFDTRFIVKWDENHGMYKCFFCNGTGQYCNLDDKYISDSFEVVGNIHKNPELLK